MNRRGNRSTRRTPISQSFVSAGIYQGFQQNVQQQDGEQAPQQQQQAPMEKKVELLSVSTIEQQQRQQMQLQQQQQQQQMQLQQQQQQQMQLQQQQQPPPPPPQQQAPQEQQQSQEQQQQLQTPEIDDDMSESGNDESTTDGGGKQFFKKIFVTRKKSSIRAREKKIRQNRQLRKTILPKNALMALNEIKGITISDFNIVQSDGGFVAVMTVNGSQYEGKGISKMAAKNNACEKALRDYVVAKMLKHPRLPRPTTAADTKTTGNENGDVAEAMEITETQEPERDDADDIPMVNLASFAIYKLFSEWESDGFCVPDLHPMVLPNDYAAASAEPKTPPKPTVRTELPNNYEAMHPATLLCIMRPGLTYTDDGTIDGAIPLHKVKCVVDEREFSGSGRSKKLARRTCAADVCNTLFGTNFPLIEE